MQLVMSHHLKYDVDTMGHELHAIIKVFHIISDYFMFRRIQSRQMISL